MKREMVSGIRINFDKNEFNYFEDEYSNEIDCDLLIISLLETINDICIDNNLDMKEKLNSYMKLGSIDNYV